MGKPLSENAKIVLNYLQGSVDKDVTYVQIAEETNLPPRTVNGILTSALVKRGLATRVAVEGQEKKLIVLTDAGRDYDPDAEVETVE